MTAVEVSLLRSDSSVKRATLAFVMAFFVLSGLAALIYQSIWATYLGVLLGHAAFGQALVLSIFMGGMALGAWLTVRLRIPPSRLLLWYGIVEMLIGILGWVFHQEFLAISRISAEVVLPRIASADVGLAWQWLSGTVLVLPQSVLLGMTFPILGAACLQADDKSNSSVLGSLYFANSLGAAVGALAATFLLVPKLGTPGALQVAGGLNLLVGLSACALARHSAIRPMNPDAVAQDPRSVATISSSGARGLLIMMLIAAGITGATSFVYEIVWVRLMNLALGTTQHSFELMLSAFILGLAIGGLIVRRFGRSHMQDVVKAAGLAQVAMGILSIICLIVYARSFELIEWIISASAATAEGYAMFLFGAAALAIFTVMPAAIFAGMTLPLMTAAVANARQQGAANIGRIYSANTLGAIIGVFLTLHVLVPIMGVRLSLILAALIDVFLGVLLLRIYSTKPNRGLSLLCLVAAVAALGLTQWKGQVSPEQLASGVFRSGRAFRDNVWPPTQQIAFYRDGKTASVSLNDSDGIRSIATNGKTDAAIQMDARRLRSTDEITMAMLAGLPLALRERYERVAVVGFGSGLTSHVLLGSDQVGQVDSIEIEPVMVQAARGFGKMNERVFEDPRSNIVFNDARTYFATGNRRYDLIVSEPSNPWVSGVASLFTQEYYQEVRRHLAPDGVMVQWIHAYELNDALLATMIAAVLEKFRFVEVYVSNEFDLILIASESEANLSRDYTHLRGEGLIHDLAARDISTPTSFMIRRLAGTDGLRAIVEMAGAVPHSDFYPVVSLEAPVARFRRQRARTVPELAVPMIPLQQMAHGRTDVANVSEIEHGKTFGQFAVVRAHLRAYSVADSMRNTRISSEIYVRHPEMVPLLNMLFELSQSCVSDASRAQWIATLVETGAVTLPYLSPDDARGIFDGPTWLDCAQPGAEQTQWLQLMDALSRRSPAEVERIATGLALQSAGLPADAREYLLLATLLARLTQGNYAGVATAENDLAISMRPEAPGSTTRSYLLALAREREKNGTTNSR